MLLVFIVFFIGIGIQLVYKYYIESKLFSALKKGEYEVVEIQEGDILKICNDGKLIYDKFEYSTYNGKHWWDYGFVGHGYTQNEYIRDLKTIASYQGYPPETIDNLLEKGFSPFEIEDFIYEYQKNIRGDFTLILFLTSTKINNKMLFLCNNTLAINLIS